MAGGLNLYGYAGGDPINFSDPFGLDCRVTATGAPCPKSGAVSFVERVGASLVRFAQNVAAGMAAAGSPNGGAAANDGPGFTTGVALHFVMLGAGARAPAVGTSATAADMLMPGGAPLGSAGSAGVREITGGLDDATAMFNSLSRGGSPVTGSNYPGQLMNLPGGGTVGLRTQMSRSPGTAATIDVNVPGFPSTR